MIILFKFVEMSCENLVFNNRNDNNKCRKKFIFVIMHTKIVKKKKNKTLISSLLDIHRRKFQQYVVTSKQYLCNLRI